LVALTNADGELADHIHMGLMVDHVSLCRPWMVGVRQLIHHVKSRAVKQDDCLQETLASGQEEIIL
jgi:Steroid receptor RNA activator (SRA1).